jgi:hypothetical protein
MKYSCLHLLYLFLFSLNLSCEKKTEWEIQPGENFVVADCIITNEFKRHELNLYWSSDSLNQQPSGFQGASVAIYDGTNTYIFEEDTQQAGRYYSINPFVATAGRVYRLIISYEGHADSAFAEMSGVTPLESISIGPADSYFRYYYKESQTPSMMEVNYNWSADPVYSNMVDTDHASEVFYSLKDIDAGKIFAPEKQVILFPHKTVVIRTKYSLNEQHQKFVRSLLLETEWRGGVFDAEQGNVPTNFRNGIRGWFAVCAVVSDTTVFE